MQDASITRPDQSAAGFEPPPMVLGELIDATVRDFAERPGMDFLGRKWTWGETGRLIDRAARGLQDQGLVKGDRLALCLPNTPFYIVLYFAAMKIGAVVVNLNPLYTEHELTHHLRDSGARMIAVPDVAEIHAKVLAVLDKTSVERVVLCQMADVLPRLKALGWRLFKRAERAPFRNDGRHVRYAELLRHEPPFAPVSVTPDDLAVLQYTGGTTGTPKGAMLTHRNLTANALQQREHVGDVLHGPQRTLAVLPFFHVFALTAVLDFSVRVGSELVMLPRFEMDAVLATIRRTKPTMFFGVPTIFIAMNALSADRMPDLSSLYACISGGAPLPLDVRTTFERLTGGKVCEGYGLTEASPIVACNPVDGSVIKENSCGPAFPGTVLEIRDPDAPERIMPQGERGEVCVRGPQVMAGYWNKPDETAATFVDGALRTGDIGYLDEDGYLFLVDRLKDLILCSGYNVYPRTIEEAAYRHPAVEEAIAIGVPDRYRGQSPKLFVKLHDGQTATAEEIRTFLGQYLSKIETPREVEIRAALPRTMVGKLSKKELVEEERARSAAS
ncbi:long-chain fatty acid--CoA ligase [Novosphingobium sp. FKTRR1]|uniref:long-chain-fatty-acid--CoA ligase n=1 Tax=Novosphingobium sp. FKTRR1 TaxID=2879118 RepID=UPI001CF0C9F0|nr:long-chain fatty acid--CoA ligase [Novosphingobium sp. FKTRR1]